MRIIFSIITLISIVSNFCFSQSNLELHPNKIEFKDDFNRLRNVYFINNGVDTISVDSVYYKNYNFYFLRFDKATRFPFKIPPYDSVKMDCILTDYYFISSTDTLDTMFIYNSGKKLVEQLNIKIDYFDEDVEHAVINGYITDGVNPISNAVVYFLYRGNYIIQSAKTNSSGFYSAVLPPGTYSIAAKKDSFYLAFYDSTYDPLNAKKIKLFADSTKAVNINLTKMENTGLSISGKIYDEVSSKTLFKGLIVARKGRHTPSKINSEKLNSLPTNSFAAIVNYDGSYLLNNIIDPDYYIVQAFSDYYVPTFYSTNNSVFWQDADSLNINSSLVGIDIFMPRDSSIGGGSISGNVTTNQGTPSDFLILAKSSNNNFFNYTSSQDKGSFELNDLPYGNYKLVAQKPGYDNIESRQLQLDSSNKNITNVLISFNITSVDDNSPIPSTIKLFQNYPNPFNPTTIIRYTTASLNPAFRRAGSSNGEALENSRGLLHVTLKVYDVLGKEVALLVNKQQAPGSYEVKFNAGNLSSGIYFYSLITTPLYSHTGSFFQTKKMILLR